MRLSISPAWFDFKKSGRDQMEFFTELTGLHPSNRFLDIACGVGRVAIPLTRFLDAQGSYEGFDVNASAIRWCKKYISSRYKNFNFTLADVRTGISPAAKYDAGEYTFPYADDDFDFVYAGSIFTHLLSDSATNYLEQTSRVLRRGGWFVATWLIYNKSTISLVPEVANNIAKHWPHNYHDYRIKSDVWPEESVLYDVSMIRDFYANAGLTILEPFRVDASYSPVRIPSARQLGRHLYYALSIIAIAR
jgi:SAM-dependent methyltransferase